MIKRLISIILCVCLLASFSTGLADADMTTSEAGAAFIAGWEGFSAYAYTDSTQWYIGYGTSCGSGDYPNGITEEQARELLRQRLILYENAVNSFLKSSGITVTQNQFDAMICLTYNLGTVWLGASCALGEYIKDGAENHTETEIVNAFGVYCHAGGEVYEPLCSRRIAEAKMFLYGDYSADDSGWVWLTLDAGEGETQNDVRYYAQGKPYGELPAAYLAGYHLEGWYTAGGVPLLEGAFADKPLAVTARYAPGEYGDYADIFPDVRQGEWYGKYIPYLVVTGVVSGCSDGLFHPERDVTCGEALKLIFLACGYGAQAASGGHWAGGYLDLAVSYGYLNAGDVTDLNAPMSRELTAKLAASALGLTASGAVSPFTDTSAEYVRALYEADVIEGVGGGLFEPDGTLLRSAICAVVWRIMNSEINENRLRCGSIWVEILHDVPMNPYSPFSFSENDAGYKIYTDASGAVSKTGVDVSYYQGEIDWLAVADAGVDFAMIRLGYRGYINPTLNLDECFEANLSGAAAAGLKVGVYFFSQAVSSEEAAEEAAFVIEALNGAKLDYPVVFDWESIGTEAARTHGLDTQTLCGCANTFCTEIKANGYTPMIYINDYAGYVKYDLSQLPQFGLWYAAYRSYPTFLYSFDMWQYTDKGSVSGIEGPVDMNICFIDY